MAACALLVPWDHVHSQEWLCYKEGGVKPPLHSMKLSRQQVIGSVLLALIVLAVLVARAWPLLFSK